MNKITSNSTDERKYSASKDRLILNIIFQLKARRDRYPSFAAFYRRFAQKASCFALSINSTMNIVERHLKL